jgi:hypothetical protein
MIHDFIEWKSQKEPFVDDEEFFKERYDIVEEIPESFKDMFHSVYVLNHKLEITMRVLDSVLDRLDQKGLNPKFIIIRSAALRFSETDRSTCSE